MTLRTTKRTESGVALMMVIMVLTALLVIGVPFVISMKLQEEGATYTAAKERAQLGQISARNDALAELFKTHPSREQGTTSLSLSVRSPSSSKTQEFESVEVPNASVDDLDELDVMIGSTVNVGELDASPDDDVELEIKSFGEEVIDARVTDEQGKVNINSASVALIGNLLASSHLAKSLSYKDEPDALPLDDATPFFSDRSPDTVDGVVVVLDPASGRIEAISYTGKNDVELTGCFRGAFFSGRWDLPAGSPVFDLRALKVLMHQTQMRGAGSMLGSFRTTKSIREIAEWSIIPYFLQTLASGGVSLKDLKRAGLSRELIERIGLDRNTDRDAKVDPEAYRDAVAALKKIGMPTSAIEMLESTRGRSAIVDAGRAAENRKEAAKLSKKQQERVKRELSSFHGSGSRKYLGKAVRWYEDIVERQETGLETFRARDFELLSRYLTTTSGIDAQWTEDQLIDGVVVTNPVTGSPVLKVKHLDWFNSGTMVRVRSIEDPGKVEYHFVGAVGSNIGLFASGVVLNEPLEHSYRDGEAEISARLRHPINVNTAPVRVLAACFAGVRLVTSLASRAADRQFVTAPEARELAEFVALQRPIANFEHFRNIITQAAREPSPYRKDKSIIDGADIKAILINAVNPNHPQLALSTASFCYASKGVFSVESTGIVNSPAGVELAMKRVREIIDVSPPEALTFKIDSQEDWAFRYFIKPVLSMFEPNRPDLNQHDLTLNTTLRPGREANLMITGPERLSVGWREKLPHMNEGTLHAVTQDKQAKTARYAGARPITFGEIEHFQDTVEGQELGGGEAFEMPTIETNSGQSGQQGQTGSSTTSTVPEDLLTKPGAVDFWIRPSWHSRATDHTLFDAILDPADPMTNRIVLFYDGTTSELVFRVSDNTTLPSTTTTRGVQPVVELRHKVTPQTFADDTWYHVSAIWGSSTPGDQVLLIDQRPVGKNIWTTELASGLQPGNAQGGQKFVVRDIDVANRFPARGVLRVGNEVIEYEEKNGTTFVVRRPDPYRRDLGDTGGRGARGTPNLNHPPGTSVTLFGYSVNVLTGDPDSSTIEIEDYLKVVQTISDLDRRKKELERLRMNQVRKVVGVGGAKLAEALRPTRRLRVGNLGGPFGGGTLTLRENPPRLEPFASIWVWNEQYSTDNQLDGFLPPNATSFQVLAPDTLWDPVSIGFPLNDGYIQVWQWKVESLPGGSGIELRTRRGGMSEYIHYARLRPAGPSPFQGFKLYRFDGLRRQQLGSSSFAPAQIGGDRQVSLVFGVSIATDSANLAELYPPSGVLDLKNIGGAINQVPGAPETTLPPLAEWIYYTSIVDNQFIANPDTEYAFRGYVGDYSYEQAASQASQFVDIGFLGSLTGNQASNLPHEAGKEIFQVLRVDEPYVGQDDWVYLADSEGEPQQRTYELLPNQVDLVRYTGSGAYVSFKKRFQYEYFLRNNPKLKMFPSGELPVASPGKLTFGNAAGAPPGGPGDATFDEIRLSRVREDDVDFYAFPADSRGRFALDPAASPQTTGNPSSPTPNYDNKSLRRHFSRNDTVKTVNKFELVGRGKLKVKTAANALWRYRESQDPRSFGMAKPEGLLTVAGEAYHYQYEVQQNVDVAELQITESLPPDALLAEGVLSQEQLVDYVFNPTRDLRTEVWPKIGIRVTSGNLPPTGGFIEIYGGGDHEIIYYERAGGGNLVNCLRGQLGTPVGWHRVSRGRDGELNPIYARLLPMREVELLHRGMLGSEAPLLTNLASDPLLAMPQIGVSRLVGKVTDDLIQLKSSQDFPTGIGYLLRDDGNDTSQYEIIGYKTKDRSSNAGGLLRARAQRTGAGLFRGRYGTNVKSELNAGMTVVELPVRYHDQYQPLVESDDLMYYERNVNEPGTEWLSVNWEEEETRNRTLATKVRVVVRFDGAPEWDSEPTNEPDGLYMFTDGKADNRLGVESESMEFRIYFHYPQGSYGKTGDGVWNDSWKHAPTIRSLEFKHRKKWRVLNREDLPF